MCVLIKNTTQTILDIADEKAHLFMAGAPVYFFKEFPKTDPSGTRRFGHFITTSDMMALAARLMAMKKVMKAPDGSSVLSHQYVMHWDGKHAPKDLQTSFFRLKGKL